jgi:uncharacterized protein YkwD
MKKISRFLFFILIFVLTLFLLKNLFFSLPEINRNLKETEKEISKTEIRVEPQVFTPPPLKVETQKEGFLTKEGIIEWTNEERRKRGISPLKENELLNQSAQLKLEDMFENQYFAHTSPKGTSLGDLSLKVGYEFIVMGENLAMGNFGSDKELVKAWMESEGHRENILNEKFEEIGVAVKRGIFEGKETWMAVCHFGKPLSACPLPNENLKKEIEENEKKLKEIEKELLSLEKEIERTKPRWKAKEKIKQYNDLVNQYNSILEKTQNLILEYNNQVQSFNECVAQ